MLSDLKEVEDNDSHIGDWFVSKDDLKKIPEDLSFIISNKVYDPDYNFIIKVKGHKGNYIQIYKISGLFVVSKYYQTILFDLLAYKIDFKTKKLQPLSIPRYIKGIPRDEQTLQNNIYEAKPIEKIISLFMEEQNNGFVNCGAKLNTMQIVLRDYFAIANFELPDLFNENGEPHNSVKKFILKPRAPVIKLFYFVKKS